MKPSEFLKQNGAGYYWIKFQTGPEYRLDGPYYNCKEYAIWENKTRVTDKVRLSWNPKGYRTTIIEYDNTPHTSGCERDNIEFLASDESCYLEDLDKWGEIDKNLEVQKLPVEMQTHNMVEQKVVPASEGRQMLKEFGINTNELLNANYLPE